MGVGGTFIRDPRVFVILPLLQIFFGINSLSRHLCRVSTRYEKTKQNKQTNKKQKKQKWKSGRSHSPNSPNFCIRPKLCGDCAFPQNFHTRKLDKIMVFYAVTRSSWNITFACLFYNRNFEELFTPNKLELIKAPLWISNKRIAVEQLKVH